MGFNGDKNQHTTLIARMLRIPRIQNSKEKSLRE